VFPKILKYDIVREVAARGGEVAPRANPAPARVLYLGRRPEPNPPGGTSGTYAAQLRGAVIKISTGKPLVGEVGLEPTKA
jgi:hypothetical protein